ncbi:Crp/Fnr family transcriptional regulator [Halobacteriales archaeon QS_4_70_19]|nr:MAG: Crp/Fnr family transcriptional regulator [Halobacteriales archaeon QS_4_70_19]
MSGDEAGDGSTPAGDSGPTTAGDRAGVLRSKRDATRYQILVEIAQRQPAVSQQEVADAIGVTAQAVSDYLQGLVAEGYVEKHGRGRYEVTNEGVDWLMSRTEALRDYVSHVSEDVLGRVEVDTALATATIEEGQPVSLSMRDGVLRATPGSAGSATGVAVTSAGVGEDVGVTEFEGLVDYEWGEVRVVSVPRVHEGGSGAVDADALAARTTDVDLLAVAGGEALAAVSRADLDPDIRFGVPAAVAEAAHRGLDVLVVASVTELSAITDALRDGDLGYDVVDAETL